ncbi:MAG: histidine kinase, partial [Nitrospiraceae bacterium]
GREQQLKRLETERRLLAERNAWLQTKVGLLESLEEVVVGRELKMIALEKELERLKSQKEK